MLFLALRQRSAAQSALCFIRLRRRPRLSSRGGMRAFSCFGGFRSAEVSRDTTGVNPWSFMSFSREKQHFREPSILILLHMPSSPRRARKSFFC